MLLLFCCLHAHMIHGRYHGYYKQFKVFDADIANITVHFSVSIKYRWLSMARTPRDQGKTSRNQEIEFSRVLNFPGWPTGFKFSFTGSYDLAIYVVLTLHMYLDFFLFRTGCFNK